MTSPDHELPNSHTQGPRILFMLRFPPLCRLSALRRDVWSCLAETTVIAWSKMWMGISAATTPSTSCFWSMKVLKRRKTREHHVTRVCRLGRSWQLNLRVRKSVAGRETGGWGEGVAESLFSGDKPSWHPRLLQGLKNYICKVAWVKNEGLGVTALDSCFTPTL